MTAAVRRAVRRPMASLTDVTFDPPFDTACCGPVQKSMSYQASTCPDVWREISPPPNKDVHGLICIFIIFALLWRTAQWKNSTTSRSTTSRSKSKVKIPYKLIYKHSLPFPGIGVTVFIKHNVDRIISRDSALPVGGAAAKARAPTSARSDRDFGANINFDRWFE